MIIWYDAEFLQLIGWAMNVKKEYLDFWGFLSWLPDSLTQKTEPGTQGRGLAETYLGVQGDYRRVKIQFSRFQVYSAEFLDTGILFGLQIFSI